MNGITRNLNLVDAARVYDALRSRASDYEERARNAHLRGDSGLAREFSALSSAYYGLAARFRLGEPCHA